MKSALKQLVSVGLITASLLFGIQNGSGLGHDFFTRKIVSLPGYVEYPKGFEELVNTTNRIAGYDVNAEMVCFFSGNAQDFTSFLEAYSRIPVAEEHQLVLHEGVGEARSPWAGTGRPCDWKVYSAPKGWVEAHRLLAQGTNSPATIQTAAKDTNYVMVVHFWTGGSIPLERVRVPSNIKVKKG